jgi:hypothetical protein
MLLRPNLLAALKRVRSNKGSPGMDGILKWSVPDPNGIFAVPKGKRKGDGP